ncbi:FAD-dependent oxidoreductase [Deinococcus sp.]|uniref:FAD-dependent oxidoreductase n=1 Tax=Deinococcus sp. TaxID=47478 RepID=UPI0025DE0E57|nr:FAD-dependent oxidoreductase [Deinococcus sp.]
MDAAGQVYAHVGQAFGPREYDVVVIGAGRMGSLAAHFILCQRPGLRLLLLDQGGLPSEDGATLLAPGLWTEFGVPPEHRAAADYTRRLILGEVSAPQGGLEGVGLVQRRGLIELLPEAQSGSQPSARMLPRLRPLPAGLLEVDRFPHARFDPDALTYNAGDLTTCAARRAVAAGADLMLNAQAEPTGSGVTLRRLNVTNTHQIVVHETHAVRAELVVIAAGAGGPRLAEHSLGTVTHHGQVYRQTPRLNVPTDDSTPVIRAAGLTLRPQAAGFKVLTPSPQRDPHGYRPTGGRLSGVPVGVRREVLQDLLEAMETVSALATGALELGRSLGEVPGAWLSAPLGGWPCSEALTGRHWLLLGGEGADLVGPGVAHTLALELARQLV